MPEQLSEFSASLEAQAGARRLVVMSGLLLSFAGLAAIISAQLNAVLCAAMALLWLAVSGNELHCLLRRYQRVRQICLDPLKGLTLVAADGTTTAARVLPGTVVAGRLVWLRFSDPTGRIGAELFAGSRRIEPDFRRAVVILRLAGADDGR